VDVRFGAIWIELKKDEQLMLFQLHLCFRSYIIFLTLLLFLFIFVYNFFFYYF